MLAQSTFTPLQWKNGIDPTNKPGFQNFMKQLADWANNQLTQTVSLQDQINKLAVSVTLLPKSQAFGSVSTNQSFDCTGANGVVLSLTINASSLLLTLNNLGVGIPVWIVMTNAFSSAIFQIAANTSAPAAYTVTAIGTAGTFNMASGFTSAGSPTTYTFFGNSLTSGPNLYLSLT